MSLDARFAAAELPPRLLPRNVAASASFTLPLVVESAAVAES